MKLDSYLGAPRYKPAISANVKCISILHWEITTPTDKDLIATAQSTEHPFESPGTMYSSVNDFLETFSHHRPFLVPLVLQGKQENMLYSAFRLPQVAVSYSVPLSLRMPFSQMH